MNIDTQQNRLKRRSPKKEKRFEGLIIAIFTIVAIIIGLVIAVNNFSPRLPNVGTDVPFVTGGPITDTDEDGNIVHVDDGVYIRKEGVYNFLLVGYDRVAKLTDVNMIAQFDTNTGAVSIIQIPRDTYARYNAKVNSYHKMNGALSYFKWELEDLASFLEENLCIKIDYYASIDLEAFRNIVDIIGGVELYVPHDMKYNDPAQNLHIDLKEGYQTLDGDKAEQFVRFRKGFVNADIGRTNAQKIFMTAFIKKFKASVSISTIAQVGAQMIKYANTNLGINDFIFFAKEVLSIDLDKIVMITLPGKDIRENKTSGAWYYMLSRSAMLDIVNKYLNVYTKDISSVIFDDELMFTNPDAEYMLSMYNSAVDVDVYSGDSIDRDGIYIPFINNSGSSSTKPTETTAPTESNSKDPEDSSDNITDTDIGIDTDTDTDTEDMDQDTAIEIEPPEEPIYPDDTDGYDS